MRQNPDGFASSRVRLRRRRCSHSGIWIGLVLRVTPRHAWHRSSAIGTAGVNPRSEEHTSELQSPDHLVCRLLLEKKKRKTILCQSRRKTSGQYGRNK